MEKPFPPNYAEIPWNLVEKIPRCPPPGHVEEKREKEFPFLSFFQPSCARA